MHHTQSCGSPSIPPALSPSRKPSFVTTLPQRSCAAQQPFLPKHIFQSSSAPLSFKLISPKHSTRHLDQLQSRLSNSCPRSPLAKRVTSHGPSLPLLLIFMASSIRNTLPAAIQHNGQDSRLFWHWAAVVRAAA